MLYEFKKGEDVGSEIKNIQDVYLDHALVLGAVKKWPCKFRNGNLNLNNKIYSWQSSGIDNM